MASEPEPVAWRWRVDDNSPWEYSDFDHGGAHPLYEAASLLAAEQRGRDAERDIAVSAAIKAIKASVVSVAKGPFMDEELPAAATLIKKVVAAIRKGDAT